jgi:hypothetical protein
LEEKWRGRAEKKRGKNGKEKSETAERKKICERYVLTKHMLAFEQAENFFGSPMATYVYVNIC